MADVPRPSRTPQEVAAAIGSFTPEQWARLERIGAKYAWKAGWQADDLVQEAAVRAAAGERRCPADVDVLRFLAEAMRGIADDEANKVSNALPRVPIKRGVGQDDDGVDVADPAPNAEAATIDEEEAAAIREEIMTPFKDNPLIIDIISGILLGYTASEICELFEIDVTAYNSQRRHMRRVLDKTFPHRRKP